jgi:hypothetical protein
MNLLFGNLPFFSSLKIVLRVSGTNYSTASMSSIRRGAPIFTSVISNTLRSFPGFPRCEKMRALICQQPAAKIELVQRNGRQLTFTLHQIAHARGWSLAHQDGVGVGFVISKPRQRSIAARRRHWWDLLSQAAGSNCIALLYR